MAVVVRGLPKAHVMSLIIIPQYYLNAVSLHSMVLLYYEMCITLVG